jgi:hypothetical protein
VKEAVVEARVEYSPQTHKEIKRCVLLIKGKKTKRQLLPFRTDLTWSLIIASRVISPAPLALPAIDYAPTTEPRE